MLLKGAVMEACMYFIMDFTKYSLCVTYLLLATSFILPSKTKHFYLVLVHVKLCSVFIIINFNRVKVTI